MGAIEDLQKQYDTLRSVPPAPVKVRPPVTQPPAPPVENALLAGVDPRETGFVRALHKPPQNTEGAAYAGRLGQAVRDSVESGLPDQAQGPAEGQLPGAGTGLTIGDLLDIDPVEAEAAGLKDAAQASNTARSAFRMGGPTSDQASPFASEWGTQAMSKIRTVPLQRSSGAFGMNVGSAENRLAELYAMKMAKDRGTPFGALDADQRTAILGEARDKARRETASVMGVHEQQANVLTPIDPQKEIQDTMAGRNIPLPAYLFGLAGPVLASRAVENLVGPNRADEFVKHLYAPFLALARPGIQTDETGGHPVHQRESKLGWMLRLAPSTVLGSWFLDPTATWQMGGDHGFGGTEHVKKILEGYQLTEEMPRIAEAYDKLTPWESGPWEKTIAAAIPIGAAMLVEPDAVTVGTGLLAAPIAKGVKELGLGVAVLKYVYKPAIAEWREMAVAGKGLSEIAAMAGPKGSVKRWLFDAVAADDLSTIASEAGGEVGARGAKLGPVGDIDQVAGRNIPRLTDEAKATWTDIHAQMQAKAAEVLKLTEGLDKQIADEEVATHIQAADAVTDYLNKERAMVGAAVLRGGQEELKAGDLVMDSASGDVHQFLGYRSGQKVTRTLEQVEEGPVAVIRPYVSELPAAGKMAELPEQVTAKLDPLYHRVVRAVRLSGDASPEAITREFRTGEERTQKIVDQLEERGVIRQEEKAPRTTFPNSPAPATEEGPRYRKPKGPKTTFANAGERPPRRMVVVPPSKAGEFDEHLVEAGATSTVPAGRLVPMEPGVKGVHELEKGGLAIDNLTGEIVHVDGFRASTRVNEIIEREAEKGVEGVVQTADGVQTVPLSRLNRLADPEHWPDARAVFRDLQGAKKQFNVLLRKAAAARAAGDTVSAMETLYKLAHIKGAAVKNLSDMSFAALEGAYRESRQAMTDAVGKLDRMRASGRYSPEVMKGLKELEAGNKQLMGLLDAEKTAARHKGALQNAQQTLINTFDTYDRSIGLHVEALAKGTTEQAAFRKGLVDTLVKPGGVLDGPAYYQQLVGKYGARAVDRVMASPVGKPFVSFLEKEHRLDANGVTTVRDFEKAIYNAADLGRRAAFEPTAGVLRTLAESKIPFELSKEYAVARTYQLAQTMSRASDWVGGTAIGRAPRAVREVARRGYERFAMIENDLGVAGRHGGIEAIRQYLTSTASIPGAFGNRDVISPAEKALAYLRSIAEGETWGQDVVVEALAHAPLPSGYAARFTDKFASGGLRRLVQDETTSGAELIHYVEQSLTALYGSQLGKTDNPDVVFRFVARAIGYGATQHDTMYDLLRATGGGISRDSAMALNWFTAPERRGFGHEGLQAFDVAGRREASAAFGTPKLVEQRGELAHLFKAKGVSTQLIHVATLQGSELYWPRAMVEALNQVPRDLAKDMKEFSVKGTYIGSRLDKISRLWRTTVVHGYFVPRAAYFVNNYLSDVFQVGTSVGLREGARMGIQSLPSYVPFVGPRLQDALFTAAEKFSPLRALFDPTVKRVMGASEKEAVEFSDGVVSARRAMQEAREDGCFDSMSTRDLLDITRRTQKRWDPMMVPAHIELSAKFMETIQSRGRLGVYLRARMSGKTREEARDLLAEALYDWKTSVPEWEHATIGRVAVFWSYRRNMLRQLGAALTEGISGDSVQYGAKALVGQTKLGRTMRLGRVVNSVPDMLYWTDPEAQLDDEGQLHELGMRAAPWWVTSQPILGNREISKAKKLWYSHMLGRDVTFETLMVPTVTTMDQLYLMNLFMQDGAATVVHLSEKAGLSPNMTTVDADELYERNFKYFTDMLAPGLSEFADNALRANFTSEGPEVSAKGIPLPKAQALFLKRLGWEDFMAASPDSNGQIRVDSNAYGLLTQLLLSLPQVSDLTKNWMIFADNPGYQESVSNGLLEAMSAWTGLAKREAHNPTQSMDYAAMEAERRMKERLSTAKKRAIPVR